MQDAVGKCLSSSVKCKFAVISLVGTITELKLGMSSSVKCKFAVISSVGTITELKSEWVQVSNAYSP